MSGIHSIIRYGLYTCGRKWTLFHCKWANSSSYISRMLYWNHSRFSVSLYEWLNYMHSNFQSIAVWISITPPTLMFIFYHTCKLTVMQNEFPQSLQQVWLFFHRLADSNRGVLKVATAIHAVEPLMRRGPDSMQWSCWISQTTHHIYKVLTGSWMHGAIDPRMKLIRTVSFLRETLLFPCFHLNTLQSWQVAVVPVLERCDHYTCQQSWAGSTRVAY